MFKSFFVAFNRSAHSLAALELACDLAALTHGKIHIGHIIEIIHEPVISSGMLAGTIETMAVVPPFEAVQEIQTFRRESEAHAKKLFEQAHKCCEERGVACETVCLYGYVEEEIAMEAQAVDLVAIGQAPSGAGRGRIKALTEAIVRASPQPVLVATTPHKGLTELVVAYDGGERALHALCAGAELARLGNLPLTLLVDKEHAGDEIEPIRKRACQYLGDYDLEYKTVVVDPHEGGGRGLAAQLAGRPEALVLMGAFGESRLKEWLIGSTTRAVLEHTQNPVILFRH